MKWNVAMDIPLEDQHYVFFNSSVFTAFQLSMFMMQQRLSWTETLGDRGDLGL